jgi:hypothetical protein
LSKLSNKTNAEEARSSQGTPWLFHERANTDENKGLLKDLQEDYLSVEEPQEEGVRLLPFYLSQELGRHC